MHINLERNKNTFSPEVFEYLNLFPVSEFSDLAPAVDDVQLDFWAQHFALSQSLVYQQGVDFLPAENIKFAKSPQLIHNPKHSQHHEYSYWSKYKKYNQIEHLKQRFKYLLIA